MKTLFPSLLLAMVASVATVPAMAAAIDVSAVVTEISAQLAPIGLLGSAVLLIVVALKAFQWVRRAMS